MWGVGSFSITLHSIVDVRLCMGRTVGLGAAVWGAAVAAGGDALAVSGDAAVGVVLHEYAFLRLLGSQQLRYLGIISIFFFVFIGGMLGCRGHRRGVDFLFRRDSRRRG